jgi:hypothetical protein
MIRTRAAAPLLLLLVACGGGAADDRPDAAPPVGDPDFDDTAAYVEVQHRTYDEGGSLSIVGYLVTEAPIWPYEVEEPVGPCRFALRTPQDCGFDCDGVCVGDTCVAQPLVQPAGTITVTDGEATRTVAFGDAGYAHFEQALPFAPGATITVSAPGDVFGAFSLAAVAPAPLTQTNQDELVLEVGEPLVFRWTPNDPGSRLRLTLGADLGHARYRSALLECDVPDEAGEVAIPQVLVDRLADGALWSCGDCFSQSMRRYRKARGTAGALPLTLWVTDLETPYLQPPP